MPAVKPPLMILDSKFAAMAAFHTEAGGVAADNTLLNVF